MKISIVERRNERRLVLEGKLIAPWTTELRNACERARENLADRKLVLYLKSLTIISEQGEDLLAALSNEGVKLRCYGVFAKQVLRQLARSRHAQEKSS